MKFLNSNPARPRACPAHGPAGWRQNAAGELHDAPRALGGLPTGAYGPTAVPRFPLKSSFKGDVDLHIGIDMDLDSYAAVPANWVTAFWEYLNYGSQYTVEA